MLIGAATTIQWSDFSKFDKRNYLTLEEKNFIRPGLQLEILEAIVNEDLSVTVTYKISDERGVPLDVDGIATPGVINPRFVLGTIPVDDRQYRSYTNRTVTSPITEVTAIQPSAESGASVLLEEGTYAFTFATRLPEDFDPDATHTVGIYMTRDLEEFELGEEVANAVYHFVPSGGPVETIREVALTQTCNNCHDPLEAHGGARREVALCVMCHTRDAIDPDTGNTIDFPEMVHKIHRGAELPSVEAGTPYQIIGFRQSVNDYSTVEFPQDIRNCRSCHPADAAQSFAHVMEPNRSSCGSCHDDVNFLTGENHASLPQISDNLCANCHFPQGELEFDVSIIGAHTIPNRSEQLAGLNLEILGVTNTNPGDTPTVSFRLTNNAGEMIQPGDLPFFNMVLAGPTIDYSFLAQERAVEGSIATETGFSYTFATPLPEDAAGTFTIGSEAFRNVTLNPGTEQEFSVRETAENPVFNFGVTDPVPVPRRTVVSDASCENCHNDLALHGTIRHNTDYCVLCHQPNEDDSGVRPPEALPARTIDFKVLVHRIHSGEDLENDYTIAGFGSRLINFNEVRYPGDRRNCEACHVGNSYGVPSGGSLPTPAPSEYYSPIPPNSAACIGCHDDLDSAAHTFINTAPFGESCGVCHGSDAEFAVPRVHARD
jgi:OmcA/MtrC family decaheme c-type cytochrome